MKVGDLVVSVDPSQPLVSGCCWYERAVLMQVDPLILVSEESDMKWSCLPKDISLKVVGHADEETIKRCMRRMP